MSTIWDLGAVTATLFCCKVPDIFNGNTSKHIEFKYIEQESEDRHIFVYRDEKIRTHLLEFIDQEHIVAVKESGQIIKSHCKTPG